MTIFGFHSRAKGFIQKMPVAALQGMRIAIDVSIWMYCALNTGNFSNATIAVQEVVVAAIMKKMFQLLQCGPNRVVVVFDGASVPAKGATQEKRRAANANKAIVTPEFREQIHRLLKRKLQDDARVDFLVAPFEADAQLAYLARHGTLTVVVVDLHFATYPSRAHQRVS